jgi:putative CocE/NonD family hydrolase
MTEPQFKVRALKNIMIPMRDGIRLAADIFLPDDQNGKFPAVLEALPYRKDDYTASASSVHYYFAERGIVGVRLDIRGTGGSEGFVTDEYAPNEQQDECDAIAWLAKQDWCNGNIGMWGTSYGGENSLQVAMLQPSSLKAIAPMFGTDDGYEDFYTGGVKQNTWSVFLYGPEMVCRNALPPYPEYSGDEWLKIWEERLEKNTPWMLEWFERQTDGPYWKRQLGRRYDRVKCPVFVIGGWIDFYASQMPRLYANLNVPKKLLIGPWPHARPDVASTPGPTINYARQLVRWFGYWLNDDRTGIMDEPPVTIYVQKFAKPGRTRKSTPGFWRYEDDWPPKRIKPTPFYLNGNRKLGTKADDSSKIHQNRFEYDPRVGTMGFYANIGMMSDDQRVDDALSLVYETEPLEEEVEIVGVPQLTLFVSSTAEVAFFVARLCDVDEDGASALVTKGVRNATRRESMEKPTPLEPGKVYELHLDLNPTAWIFERGHIIRIAISGSDFPELWPSPLEATNTVHSGPSQTSKLVLPILPHDSVKSLAPTFEEPHHYLQFTENTLLVAEWKFVNDITGEALGITGKHVTRIKLLDGVGTLTLSNNVDGSVSLSDYGNVSFEVNVADVMESKSIKVELRSRTLTQSTRTMFTIAIDLDVKLNGAPRLSRKWTKTGPRNLM